MFFLHCFSFSLSYIFLDVYSFKETLNPASEIRNASSLITTMITNYLNKYDEIDAWDWLGLLLSYENFHGEWNPQNSKLQFMETYYRTSLLIGGKACKVLSN